MVRPASGVGSVLGKHQITSVFVVDEAGLAFSRS
jgi:hypothetical protein